MSVINIRVRPELYPYDLQWHRIDKVPLPLDEEVYIWPIEARRYLGGLSYALEVNPPFPEFTHWRKIIGPPEDD